jgi:hypothetical protein
MKNTLSNKIILAGMVVGATLAGSHSIASATTLEEVVAQKTLDDCLAARDIPLWDLGSGVVTLGDITCNIPEKESTLAEERRARHKECMALYTPRECYELRYKVPPVGADEDDADPVTEEQARVEQPVTDD